MFRKRVCRQTCTAMALLALSVRAVLAAGAAPGQAMAAAGNPRWISWMLYWELGQTYVLPEEETALEAPAPEKTPEEVPAPAVRVEVRPAEPEGQEPELAPEEPELSTEDRPSPEGGPPQENGPSQEDESLPGKPAASQEEPAPEPPFTREDADGVSVVGQGQWDGDVLDLLEAGPGLDFSGDGPKVLIVHTHSSEAYSREPGQTYAESDTLRTQDPDYNVIRVGEELARVLEARGISVIHDTSVNDYPSYNGAYSRTLEKILQWKQTYPGIRMVLDVHRDARQAADGTHIGSVADADGEPAAQVMLVVGTDQGGLEHPHWEKNLAAACQLQAAVNRRFPGLMRPVDLRTERFNQHVTDGSLLLEVGSTGNTLTQALTAVRAVGERLADLIQGPWAGT